MQSGAANKDTFSKCSRGAIAVEFGFIAPVILVMLLGIVEVALALSNNLAVQSAARAGTHFGMIKPPVQGDMAPVTAAVKAALPSEWTSAGAEDAAQINASLTCECQVSGPIACNAPCGQGEQMQTYLKVDVSKVYTPLVTLRYFAPSFQFKNSSQVRLK